jgi:hypothetical protein
VRRFNDPSPSVPIRPNSAFDRSRQPLDERVHQSVAARQLTSPGTSRIDRNSLCNSVDRSWPPSRTRRGSRRNAAVVRFHRPVSSSTRWAPDDPGDAPSGREPDHEQHVEVHQPCSVHTSIREEVAASSQWDLRELTTSASIHLPLPRSRRSSSRPIRCA